jgi:hypothetical protein
MGAFRALETAQIIPGGAIHDAGERHAALTFWTTGSFEWSRGERGCQACDASLDGAGAKCSLSPMDANGVAVMESSCPSASSTRWSILLTFQKK